MPDSPYRLPENVRPLCYRLTLEPDLTAFTFAGQAEIEVDVKEPTAEITLNAAELRIASAQILPAGLPSPYPSPRGRGNEAGVGLPSPYPSPRGRGNEAGAGGGGEAGAVEAVAIEHDAEAERATLRFPSPIPAGQAVLRTAFTGVLNDQLCGFYRSRYTDADGAERHLAATQFEATDARRAFPCWDEPAAKAAFEVTLVVPEELEAVSNMPVARTEAAPNGRKAVAFERTPPMSTYLLAFVVGDMACVEGDADDGTRVRVWATRGKEELGRFALENSIAALRYMNEYFGVPYPLAKMDHIAVPDFAAGAMENWGAITYRETALLYDPENSAPQAKQRIMEVVAHEMAHMWFGDLVTMEWWDDLWLNESFASWMGDKTVDHLYPEWEMWTQFVSHDANAALGLDGLRNSHPIEAQVDDPAEIRELFDAISYSKGGSVLRMLEDYVGPETFRDGLRAYLARHAYGNARGAHLWEAIGAAADESGLDLPTPVVPLMEAWIKQTGYPALSAEITRGGEGAQAAVTQSRFLYDRLLGEPEGDALWPTPVSIVSSGGGAAKRLLSGASDRFDVDGGADWVKLNAGQTGFFRVAYAEEEWRRLGEAVAAQSLPPVDRLGLQNDAYALVKSGRLPAAVFLDLAESYAGERDAVVWGDLAANLRGMESLLASTPHLSAFRAYARDLFAEAAEAFGWDAQPGDGHLEALRRSVVVSNFGGYGGESALREALARFRRHASGEAPLAPDVRAAAFGLAAQQGGREVYDELWRLHHAADLHEEKARILGALTRTRDAGLLADLLRRAMSGEVRSQDAPIALVQAGANPEARAQTWEFVKENWEEIDRRYGKGGFAIMRLVSIAGGFASAEREEDVRAFFEAHPAPSAARSVRQALESIRLNARWLEINAASAGERLASRAG